jgi:chaperonin GroES
MRLKPLYDRVVVKQLDAEEKTAGGVLLPDSAREKPAKGKVVAVGPGVRNATEQGEIVDGRLFPLSVKVGDVVWYGKYTGTDVKVSGEELKILRERDILGVEG